MSHSFVMAHDGERRAFEDFARTFPKLNTMLVDTYDTIRGVENVAESAARLATDEIKIQAIRLDSGNLEQLSREVAQDSRSTRPYRYRYFRQRQSRRV